MTDIVCKTGWWIKNSVAPLPSHAAVVDFYNVVQQSKHKFLVGDLWVLHLVQHVGIVYCNTYQMNIQHDVPPAGFACSHLVVVQ